ncbi:hypothetical protein [Sphingorhabdus sp.]|jgi:ABC-type glycerol-3-phosphate transport system substrate-binding protein|uniref:hypothetical protein n=1 Tax=Sphingorhabdus sp. TaxID=1902408 RepID=UPI002FD9620E|nr:hypothetical protein [Sphingomonadaceae bacterium]
MKILKSTLISGLSALALAACSGSDTSDTVATDTEVVQDDATMSDGAQATTDKNIVGQRPVHPIRAIECRICQGGQGNA